MENDILDDPVSTSDLQRYERAYHNELVSLQVRDETKFNYAWCLVRSRYPADIRKGIYLLEELFTSDTSDGTAKRDYLFYLAMGNARLKEYNQALSYTSIFLQLEPNNQQVTNLEAVIKKKIEEDGLKGVKIASGIALLVGGIVGLGFALAKKK